MESVVGPHAGMPNESVIDNDRYDFDSSVASAIKSRWDYMQALYDYRRHRLL